MPTGLIFVPTGQNQTQDLQFVNHGYYVEGTYSHTVTDIMGISMVTTDNTLRGKPLYDLSGRSIKIGERPLQPGIYVCQGRKMIFTK